jgi:tetratricopeptide (TPR) repeat protein
VAELTFKTGAMAYDVGSHVSARQYFLRALDLARSCGDSALGGKVLAVMSHQENFLDRPRQAADLARAAKLGAAGHTPPRAHAMYCVMEARALARQRESRARAAAMNEAEDYFLQGTDGEEPSWIQYFDSAELHDEFGHCLCDLHQSEVAVREAERALESSDPAYPRSRTFSRLVLAAADLQRGEVERACDTAIAALDLVVRLRSSRVRRYVQDVVTQLAPFAGSPALESFRHRLWTVAGTSFEKPSTGRQQAGRFCSDPG